MSEFVLFLIVFGDKTRREWRQERGISPQTLSITLKSHWRRQNPSQDKLSCCQMTYSSEQTIISISINFCDSRNPVQWDTNHLLADRRINSRISWNLKPANTCDFYYTFINTLYYILSLFAPGIKIRFMLLLLLLFCWTQSTTQQQAFTVWFQESSYLNCGFFQ